VGRMSDLRLLLTPEHPCSYLPVQRARTVFVAPETPIDTELQSNLSRAGFRRSGQYLYRPQCAACRACIPTRVPVDAFRPRRSQRRCLARNADLEIDLINARRDPELYALYARYIDMRHDDGDMYPASEAQYDSFLLGTWSRTLMLRARLEGTVVAVGVIDLLDDGVSAVYSFFDPALEARSLGTFTVLSEIDLARSLGLPYLYLGYWIAACTKMTYKADFRPQEHFDASRWTRVDR
jgi:arginyl-tRNA--protein-N-Asp/Glu arginylyltransferase